MSDSEEAELFGEVPVREVEIELEGHFPTTQPVYPSSWAVIKLPSAALSVDFSAPYAGAPDSRLNTVRYRHGEKGEVESNARLVEWEDGSWTLVVGSEHFRVFQRREEVAIFDKQKDIFVSVGNACNLMNVIPGSLDSKTHQRVVAQTAVSRKLVESRKVFLASGADHRPAPVQPELPVKRKRGPALTADFLEAGLSVKAV